MARQLNIRGEPDTVFETHATRPQALGTRLHVPDGRVFRAAQAGSTALVAGRTAQITRPDAALRDRGLATQTDPLDNVVQIALGSVVNSDQSLPVGRYEEGLLYVVSGGGAGQVYRVRSSEKGDETNNELKVVIDAARIVGRVNSTTRVTLFKNFFTELVIAEAPPSTAVIGISPAAVPANEYFWLQTHGAAAVLQEGGLQVNLQVAASPEREGAMRHAVIVVPPLSGDTNPHDARSVAVVNTRHPEDRGASRLAPVTGLGVVPETALGYVIDPGYDGAQALVHVDIEV